MITHADSKLKTHIQNLKDPSVSYTVLFRAAKLAKENRLPMKDS